MSKKLGNSLDNIIYLGSCDKNSSISVTAYDGWEHFAVLDRMSSSDIDLVDCTGILIIMPYTITGAGSLGSGATLYSAWYTYENGVVQPKYYNNYNTNSMIKVFLILF